MSSLTFLNWVAAIAAREASACVDAACAEAHAFRRGSGSTDVGLRIMSLGTEKSTVHSDAELRVITIKTEAGDNVKYSGNPAELPGARFEITKALRRSGAFALLVEHNASRLNLLCLSALRCLRGPRALSPLRGAH